MIAIDSTIVTSPSRSAGMNPAGIDGEKLRVVLDTSQQVHRPQAVGKSHFLEQPDDAETPAFAENGNHGHESPSERPGERAAPARSCHALDVVGQPHPGMHPVFVDREPRPPGTSGSAKAPTGMAMLSSWPSMIQKTVEPHPEQNVNLAPGPFVSDTHELRARAADLDRRSREPCLSTEHAPGPAAGTQGNDRPTRGSAHRKPWPRVGRSCRTQGGLSSKRQHSFWQTASILWPSGLITNAA